VYGTLCPKQIVRTELLDPQPHSAALTALQSGKRLSSRIAQVRSNFQREIRLVAKQKAWKPWGPT
jgi:hypothetical protein